MIEPITQFHPILSFAEVDKVLQLFVTGLQGTPLKIQDSELTFTDTETLFLPPTLHYFSENKNNFRLYKAIVGHLWAQIHFGTWQGHLSAVSSHFSHRDKAIRLFHVLERLRLDSCLARELPGLYRDMGILLDELQQPRIPFGWEDIAHHLAHHQASVTDSYTLLTTVYSWQVPPPVCYQGILLPEQVATTLQQEKISRANIESAIQPHSISTPVTVAEERVAMNDISQVESIQRSHESATRLTSGVQPSATVPAGDTIPEHYLTADIQVTGDSTAGQSNKPSTKGIATWWYPEWDYRQQNYRQTWCALQEVTVPLGTEHFVANTLQHYRGFVKRVRRVFELLRTKPQLLKRQAFGDEIDVDVLVEALADHQSGQEMSEQLFTRLQKRERNVAVIFMVDMSGSTRGWINQAVKESLVLLCEVLETLGDRYAIYGFSGATRYRCEIYPIKRFDEAYNSLIKQRLSGITPREYTRMGVTIRHLIQLFRQIEATTKMLITLSDGKPDDDDVEYRGTYSIEDTRQALWEAKRENIHPFCITIDTDALTYLPHLYGKVNYTVINRVEQLPLKVSDIYRKLTT